ADRRGQDRPLPRRRALARRFGDAPPVGVDRQASAYSAPARSAVELHAGVADLATEAGDAADQSSAEHDAGAESRPRRQDDQRADTARWSERPFRQRERVDVVVDEDRQTEPIGEDLGEGLAGELGHVGDLLTDPAAG